MMTTRKAKAASGANAAASKTISNNGRNSTKNNFNLTAADLQKLAASFITPELAKQAGIYRVDSITGAEIVGRRPKASVNYAGIVFTYSWPGEDEPRENRLRRDYPDLEQQPDGSIKEKGKYLSPPGRGNLLYVPPGTSAEWLNDPSIPTCITEGEKKALALYRLFSERGEKVLVIGLSGVWGWRSTVGKAADSNGKRRDVKGVIPDFGRITWQGREVRIIFDANVTTNDKVKAARRGLAKELERRDAIVQFVDIPADIPGVNGVDDLLAIEGPDFVARLLEQAIAKTLAADADASANKEHRISKAELLINIVLEEAELFHNDEGRTFASFTNGSHRETLSLKSSAFKRWLGARLWQRHQLTAHPSAIAEAMLALEGRAAYEGETREVYVRLAEHGENIYLDLCDPDWHVVEITPTRWQIIAASDCPVRFRRANGMLALPEPQRGGSLDDLRQLLNLGEEYKHQWILIAAWLVAAFRPCGPYPVLAIHGEQGSAKSTTCRMLRRLIDPNTADVRSVPKDERDLMIAACNGWILAYDNLTHISESLSNAFCRIATGGGLAVRTLYENDEETIFAVQRPILVNGITEITTRSDLLDRSMLVYLLAIPEDERRDEASIWREFEEKRPGILGAMLDALSVAMRELPQTRLERLPRMADFALWATAAESGLGLTEGDFLNAYASNRSNANDLALESSPVAAELRDMFTQQDQWEGTSTALLAALNGRLEARHEDPRRKDGWPRSGRALTDRLKQLAPNLRRIGFDIQTRRSHGGKRLINITFVKHENTVSPTSPSSPDNESTELPTAPTVTQSDDGDVTAFPGDPLRHPVNSCAQRPGDAGDAGDAEPQPLTNNTEPHRRVLV